MSEKNKLKTKLNTESETKIETKTKKFFIEFLLYYNIINLEDCINWCKNNIDQHIITINRILDVTWEVIIKPEDFANYKILRVKGKKLLSKNLLHYSNRSYQKKIKKYIYNNI